MTTSMNITSTDAANKKTTRAITNINPDTSNAELKTAAQLFTAISTNNFIEADRIIKINVDESYAPKIQPTLEVGNFSYDGYYYSATVNYNGDGTLAAVATSPVAGKNAYTFFTDDNSTVNVSLEYGGGNGFTGLLVASAGTSYASTSITISHSA